MFGFVVLSPFMSQTSRTTSFVSAAGGGVNQNSFYPDGTNVTSASNAVARTEPGIDFIQDIQHSVDRSLRRVRQRARRRHQDPDGQGGNRFLWDGSYYGQSRADEPADLRPIKFTGTRPERVRTAALRERETTLGGPVIRDRVWFFAGYE